MLEVIREEELQANAARMGAHCLRLLRELQVRLPGAGGRLQGASSLVAWVRAMHEQGR